MNPQDRPTRTGTGASRNADSGGQASARHQGLRRPSDDQQIEQKLGEVGLEDQGEVLEDHLRDRRSSGAPPSQHLRPDPGDRGRDPRH